LSQRVRLKQLPLAVSREVAAHLQLLEGVRVVLHPQRSQEFDYSLSQIDSLEVDYDTPLSKAIEQQVQKILAYYGDRYGAWEIVE
jgi:hypothetical protein